MKRVAALLLAATASVCAVAQQSAPHILYGESGRGYRKGELPQSLGSGWLALVPRDGVWRLEPARFVSTPFSGPHDPQGLDDSTSLGVTPDDALALFDLPELAPGKVDTPDMRFKSRPRAFDATTVLPLPCNGRDWSLRVRDDRLLLSDGVTSTDVGEVSDDAPEHRTDLLWAGDLDHDGRLDLVLLRSGIDGSMLCVWLSRRAAQGQLVGKAACLDQAGC